MTGYLHPQYAESLCEFGEPLQLPKSGGWLLTRRVDGVQADAMSAYPLFACLDWKSLKSDFNQLSKSLVSVVVVTDPFGEYDEPLLRDCFGDLVAPFKSHFACDLRHPLERAISNHHARNARIGLARVAVERCEDPSSHLDDWVKVYSVLIQHHQISGIRAFSRNSFAKQLKTPGMVCFRAISDQQTVGNDPLVRAERNRLLPSRCVYGRRIPIARLIRLVSQSARILRGVRTEIREPGRRGRPW